MLVTNGRALKLRIFALSMINMGAGAASKGGKGQPENPHEAAASASFVRTPSVRLLRLWHVGARP
jgi:hypothetical protein